MRAMAAPAAETAGLDFAHESAALGRRKLAYVVPPRDHSEDPRPPGAWSLYADVLDANAAAAADFELLPGIGPGIARRLVAERDARGGYCTAAEVAAVAAIGVKRWAAVTPQLSVRPARRCSRSS